jgi:hypothetical protein
MKCVIAVRVWWTGTDFLLAIYHTFIVFFFVVVNVIALKERECVRATEIKKMEICCMFSSG